jgi:thiamine-monophosphate kinase
MKLSQLGEFGLIDEIKRIVGQSNSVTAGIGDDAAVVALDKKRYMLLTTDMLIEGVHFTAKDAPQAVGHKAMACNLSDIAAMGGVPKFALVSLGAPASMPVEKIKAVYRGMQRVARKFGVTIVGGDTNKNNKLVISVALTGEVKKKRLVTRAGARAGDVIFVSGALGDSYKSKHHLHFTPRLKEAAHLVKDLLPHAMIDISDGLVADLHHVLKAGGVGARIYEEAIRRRGGCSLKQALYDGEDFELLFTLTKKQTERFINTKPFFAYAIGKITPAKGRLELVTKDENIKILDNKGFRHF